MAEFTSETDISESAELLPPQGEEAVGYRVFEILDIILGDKEARGLPKKWTRNYELSRNRHWKRKSNRKVSLVSANLLYTHRTRVVNLLTDNNPTFNIRRVGRSGEDTDIYQSLLHTCEFWWNDTEQQHVFESSVTNGETYGCTIEKIRFNPELEHGFGEVETELIDPFFFGVFPVSTMDNQKGIANLHYYPMAVRQARRLWPHMADKIQSDEEILKELGDDREEMAEGRAKSGFLGTISSVIKHFKADADNQNADEEQTLIVEAWVKDYTMERYTEPIIETLVDPINGEPVLDPDTQEPMVGVVGEREFEYPKYPGYIRMVTCCNGGKVILDDAPNPSINPDLDRERAMQTYLYDKFPFTLTQSITDTTDPWGISDYEQLDALQMEVNKSISQYTMIKDKTARVKLINPKTSGVKNEEFDNVPGIINPSNEAVAAGIRYMDPPQMPVDIVNALTMYKDLFFLVAGAFDLDQGKDGESDVIAYKAIAALIERASTMLKGKIRNYSKMIRDRGRMYLSHVMNWYTDDRWITYEEGGEEQSIQINGSDLIAPAKLVVVSGSTMPISKVQEREEALALFQMNAIDLEELLKKIEWPDRKAVLTRMELGPIGQFIQRLVQLGLPDIFAQFFQEIASIDDKKFEKALEKGDMPSIPALIKAYIQSGGQLEEPPTPKEEAELQETVATTEKIYAETALTNEKINTEKVQQKVAKAGVGFDEEKLRLEKAETIQGIKESIERLAMEVQQLIMTSQLKVVEMKDNKELKEEEIAAKKTADAAQKKVTTPAKKKKAGAKIKNQGKTSKKKQQGPHRESGLKSNNKPR